MTDTTRKQFPGLSVPEAAVVATMHIVDPKRREELRQAFAAKHTPPTP